MRWSWNMQAAEKLALRDGCDFRLRSAHHPGRKRDHDVPGRPAYARPLHPRIRGLGPRRTPSEPYESLITRTDFWTPGGQRISAVSLVDIAAQIEGIEWVILLIIIAVLIVRNPRGFAVASK